MMNDIVGYTVLNFVVLLTGLGVKNHLEPVTRFK